MIRIAGLWGKQSEKGLYLKGKNLNKIEIPENSKLIVFKNTSKLQENEPDYILYLDNA